MAFATMKASSPMISETGAQFEARGIMGRSRHYSGRKRLSALVTVALAIGVSACGGGSAPSPAATPSGPSPAPQPVIPTITIRSTGVAPRELTVAVGDRVTFINNDSQPHDPAGGPDPANPDCREIDAVGFLVPGQSRQTSPLPVARTCDFHDHSNHDPIFNGRIIIR